MENKTKYKAKSARKPLLKEEAIKRLISTLIVVALVVSIVGYFIYFTGLPARVLTGAEIYKKNPDGTLELVDKVKVAEMNYYYSAVYNQYAQVGLVSENTDLDAQLGEGMDFTFRDMLYDSAAETMTMAHLTYEAAMATEDFEPRVTQALLEDTVELLRQNAAMYGITVDDFLQSVYGRGMTLRTYTAIVEKEIIVEEFRAYLRQNVFFPNMEEVEALFDADPANYAKATFNYYFFPVVSDESMSQEELEAAVREAEVKAAQVAARAIHSDAFRLAVIEIGGPEVEPAFADGRDPTLAEAYTKALTERLNPQIAEFVFSSERQSGDTTVLVSDEGSYVVYFAARGLDDEATVSYRSLFIEDPNMSTEDEEVRNQSAAQLVAQAQAIIDGVETEEDFIRMVQTTSDDIQQLYAAGLVNGETFSTFTNPERITSEEELVFAEWLFSEDRQWGDTYILESPTGVRIIYFRDSIPAYMNAARENIILERRTAWEASIMPEDVYEHVVIKRNLDFARY